MALKGIVESGNYTFSAANKTITFSSDYIGMSLSDITYITNIKSGVATVIYDPFDATKGGVLSGLVLTLNFNTTTMSDTDPLQIIVGYTPKNADPQLVKIVESPDQIDDTALLNRIADNLDFLNLTLDEAEGIQVNTRDRSIKKDSQGAIINSDCVDLPLKILRAVGDGYAVDTTGYNTTFFMVAAASPTSGFSINVETSTDGIIYNQINCLFATPNGPFALLSAGSGLTITTNVTYTIVVNSLSKFSRIRVISSTSGSISITPYLRNVSNFSAANTNINIQSISGTAPSFNNLNTTASAQSTFGGITVGGSASPASNIVPFPIMVGGREAPHPGALGGIVRQNLLDPQGRYILGGDYDGTRPRDPVTQIGNPYNTAPIRGVGGIPNNMIGAQNLTVTDIQQAEGDTHTMLLKQILQELKILNQQFTELPAIINNPLYSLSDPQEYRDDNSKLF